MATTTTLMAHVQQPPSRLYQTLKGVKSSRQTLGARGQSNGNLTSTAGAAQQIFHQTMVKRKDITAATANQHHYHPSSLMQQEQLLKNLVSPRRTTTTVRDHHQPKKDTKSNSSINYTATIMQHNSGSSSQLMKASTNSIVQNAAKLTKTTSQKMLNRQKRHKSGQIDSKVSTKEYSSNPVDAAQLQQKQYQQTFPESGGQPTMIQPPISSTTMVNASRRKFGQSPRNTNEFLAQINTKKSTRIQRQLSNKLLSPVSRKMGDGSLLQTVTSPQGKYLQDSASVTKNITNRDSLPRPKSSVTNFNSIKNVTASSSKTNNNNNMTNSELQYVGEKIQKLHLLDNNNSRSKTTMLTQLQHNQQTQSQAQVKKHPQQLTTSQTQSTLSRVLSPRGPQLINATNSHNIMSAKPGAHWGGAGGQSRVTSGMLGTVRSANGLHQNHTMNSRTSETKSLKKLAGAAIATTHNGPIGTGAGVKTTNSLTNESAALKNNKINNVLSGRKGSTQKKTQAKEQEIAVTVLSEDGMSIKSGKTNIIDEVLHQQKTDAYRELQKQAANQAHSVLNQYGIVETSSMGQIIEQDDEMHDQSIDKEDIAGADILQKTVTHHTIVDEDPQFIRKPQQIYHPQVQANNTYFSQPRISSKTNLAAAAALGTKQFTHKKSSQQMKQLTSSVEKFQAKSQYGGNVNGSIASSSNQTDGTSQHHQNLRILNNRAKTTLNLQQELHLRQQQQEEHLPHKQSHFKNRKQSNDTVIQNKSYLPSSSQLLHQKGVSSQSQSALAMLLLSNNVNTSSQNANAHNTRQVVKRQNKKAAQQQTLTNTERNLKNQQNQQQFQQQQLIMAHPQAQGTKGPTNESLVTSYLTGSGSIGSQKWMNSSKSAKNVLTSCSLGPKSELRQTEQANAESLIKILPQHVHKQSSVLSGMNRRDTTSAHGGGIDVSSNFGQQEDHCQQYQHRITDQQGLNTSQPNMVIQNTASSIAVLSKAGSDAFGPKKQSDNSAGIRGHRRIPTESSVPRPIQESFKSTLVDYTESMNENQITTNMTVDQSRDLLIKACKSGDLRTIRKLSQIVVKGSNSGGIYDLANFKYDQLKGNQLGEAKNSNHTTESYFSSYQGNTPLHLACINGHVDIAEILIRKMNAKIDATNSRGETPLHSACMLGHKGVIERLLLARASTNIRDARYGNTPLHILTAQCFFNNKQQNKTDNLPIQAITTSNSRVPGNLMLLKNNLVNCCKDNQNDSSSMQNEQLTTEDFAPVEISVQNINPKSISLIELLLPFAEESKSIPNNEGILPWQLAENSEEILALLKPNLHVISNQSSVTSQPVTASQIQGQGNNKINKRDNGMMATAAAAGRNNFITRNHHSTKNINNNDNILSVRPQKTATLQKAAKKENLVAEQTQLYHHHQIEVQPVSEQDIAGIFTFFNASNNGGEGASSSVQQMIPQEEDQSVMNTFEHPIHVGEQSQNYPHSSTQYADLDEGAVGQQSSESDIYQTTQSNKPAGRQAALLKHQQQPRSSVKNVLKPHVKIDVKNQDEEQKKNPCQDFLDEDIEQIDNLLQNACEDGNEYGGPRPAPYYTANHVKPPKTTSSSQNYPQHLATATSLDGQQHHKSIPSNQIDSLLKLPQSNKLQSHFLQNMQQIEHESVMKEPNSLIVMPKKASITATEHSNTGGPYHKMASSVDGLSGASIISSKKGEYSSNPQHKHQRIKSQLNGQQVALQKLQNYQQHHHNTLQSVTSSKTTLIPQKRTLSTTFDKQDNSSHSAVKKGSTSQYSPQKKILVKTAVKQSKKNSMSKASQQHSMTNAALNNQTIDSSKSLNAGVTQQNNNNFGCNSKRGLTTVKLNKVKTVANLRPQSTSHQQQQHLSQTRSSAQLKLANQVQAVDQIGPSKAQNSARLTNKTTLNNHTSAQRQAPTSQGLAASGNTANQQSTTRLLQSNQKQTSGGSTAGIRTIQSAMDLKQKVDKQAGQIMKRTLSKPQLAEIRLGPEQFVAHQLLGTGSFGEVFLVERKQDKKLLAMKVLSKKKIKQQNLKKYAITERNVMASMGEHPFIVQLRYAFQTREHLFLISDYCPGGDLSQYLEIEGCFSEEKSRLYIQEILLGIEALHKQNIIFRDLKPDNVIIDKNGHAMLTDFGLSRENVRRAEIGAKSFCGSYAYLAPEMLKKNGHGKAVDWYLLGVILFEMVTGLPPYYADDKDQLFKNIMKDTLDMRKIKGEQNLSTECIDLMSKLLEKDPARRIGTKKGAIEIRQHPFFRSTDWDEVFQKTMTMPEPYLANMAMEIIKSQPYLVAGHPHTVGDVCPREHRSYLQGWSFTETNQIGNESQLSSSEKLKIDHHRLLEEHKNNQNSQV